MHTLVVDYETFFDTDYTLKKLPTLLYIRDPRFLIWGAAVKWDDEPAKWIRGPDLEEFFAQVPWDDTIEIVHNALFDRTISYEKFGIVPARRVDTAGLCRALLPRDLSFELDAIGPILGLGGKVKGGDPLQRCKGIRELPPDLEQDLAEYACGDAEIEYGIFKLLYEHLPRDEQVFMDLTIRMGSEGLLHFDDAMGGGVEAAIEEDRNHKLSIVGVTPEQLRSREQFAELLRARGVEPPTKISPKTGKETYAFSKQDPAYVALGAEPEVADLIQARNVWASNNAITRVRNLGKICALAPYTLPVQVNYNGAHTGRLSGGGGINMQNLNARGPQGKLRHAITAPPGCVIVVKDLKGIELRMNMWFSGQHDVLEFIRQGGDPYVDEAVNQFNIRPEEVTKLQRQLGKVIRLGAQYGMGHRKFRAYVATGPYGMDPIYLNEEEAFNTIQNYRRKHPWVKASWDWLTYVGLPALSDKGNDVERGPVILEHEQIRLPNGLALQYPNLVATEEGWVWGLNGKTHRIYGGIMQENIVQALAGVAIKEQMIEIDRELGGGTFAQELFAKAMTDAAVEQMKRQVQAKGAVVHQVHDEILAVCREQDAEDVAALMDEVMTTPLAWAPDLPLEVEGGYDYRYTK